VLTFSALMFSASPDVISPAVEGGAAGFVIDWENKAKVERQAGFDTQINFDTAEDLRRVVSQTTLPVICRVNHTGKDLEQTLREVDTAIALGASEIFVPMVRHPAEVERVLKHVASRVHVGILIETDDAVRHARELGGLPLSRVYVGLNDLAITRGTTNIFEAVADGTLDRVRQHIAAPFGFAGATLPDHGFPIPARLLMNEFARLDCSYTFLRRSFLVDSASIGIAEGLRRVRHAIEDAFATPPAERERFRQTLVHLIETESVRR
jgi:citrate lyase beta subunit